MKYSLMSLIFFAHLCLYAQAKVSKNTSPYPTKYSSSIDQGLTLKTINVAPAYDNVGGVYKKACETTLADVVSTDHFWSLSPTQGNNSSTPRFDTYSENPIAVQAILKSSKSDGLITCAVTKSPQGLRLKMVLYTDQEGLPLIEETYEDPNTFEIEKFKSIVRATYEKVKAKLPYNAFVSSRRGQVVTVNRGRDAGLKEGNKLAVAQILKIHRHPKLKFMVGVEKEIIGQILLTKVDDFSSFGEIAYEKEAGVVEKNSKLLPSDFVQYSSSGMSGTPSTDPLAASATPSSTSASNSSASTSVSAPSQEAVSGSANPDSQEWVPPAAPQFGKFFFLGGLSHYSLSSVLYTGDSFEAQSSWAPTFQLGGEVWITPEFFGKISYQQSFLKISNPLIGSTPDSLNFALSQIDFVLGYKYSFTGNFWGPSISAGLGYMSDKTSVTDSIPIAFSSFQSSGIGVYINGYFPVTQKNDIALGAEAQLLLTNSFSESPLDSGKSSPSFSQFGVYGSFMYTSNINLIGKIKFNSINSTFDGSGSRPNAARSINEKTTNYIFGIEYLF